MPRPREVSVDDVVRLRNAGFTVPEIADDLDCSLSSVRNVLKDAGMTGSLGPVAVERQTLLDLWSSDKSLSEVGAELGCSVTTVLRLGRKHALPSRTAFNADPDDFVSPEEDAASAESLRLSPWVAARIKELGLGMPRDVLPDSLTPVLR